MTILPTASADIPLIVDLDGTLILTDTLQEGFVRLIFRNPLAALGGLVFLLQGRAAFKRRIQTLCRLDAKTLPWRGALINLLTLEKARNRKIYLVTAADQEIADDVSSAIGLFDGAQGSNGKSNLKGARKLAWLREFLAGEYIYAGDSVSDLPLFLAARGVILCDVAKPVASAVERAGVPILARLDREHRPWRRFLAALRAHHWSKNLLIFLPLFLGHAYTDTRSTVTITLAFFILCALASGTYLVNDLADLDADRRHATKRKRPFAAGDLSLATGLTAALATIIGAMVAAILLSPPFAAVLGVYLIGTLAYSFGLKRVPFLDVSIVGTLFTLRLVMGASVLGLSQSPWLLAFSLIFFFSLALAKRYGEIRGASGAKIAGRGYQGDDWPLVLAFGVAGTLASLVVLLLFVTSNASISGAYTRPEWLYAVPAPIFAWQLRIWLLSHRSRLHDDPVVFALKDRISLILGVLVAVFLALAL